jgi:hypothetical protein
MGDIEALDSFRDRRNGQQADAAPSAAAPVTVSFNRHELRDILNVYGRLVAAGEMRDYAIDMLKERAVFSLFRHMGEMPLYRIEKNPALRQRQGMYSVVAATGLILKRGNELDRVLAVLDRKVRLVAG